MDDPACPSRMEVRIKASKTDPFRQGISLFIGKVSSDLCPVSAMLVYLVVRGSHAGSLFKFLDGRSLTRQRLVIAVKEALDAAGAESGQYSGHSFCIGAATTAAARGLEDSTVRTLGRRKSRAYLEYIRTVGKLYCQTVLVPMHVRSCHHCISCVFVGFYPVMSTFCVV